MIQFRVILSLIILFSIGNLLADEISNNGVKSTVSQVTPPSGSAYYLGAGMWFDIGKYHYNSNNSNYINRTILDFSLSSIPSNATITTVNLIYAVNSDDNLTTHFFRITEFAGGSDPEAAWRNVGESATLFTNVAYGNGTLNSTRLKTMVEQNKGNHFKLGVVAANESDLSCGARINFTIYVSFTLPPANINIFATNNFFTSTNIQGLIFADGTGNAPKQITRQVGTTATFQGITDQIDIEGYQRVWVVGSLWQKYLSDGSEQQITDNTNIIYITNPLTSADAYATYKANFKKLCNLTVDRNNPYGGIVKILLNGQQFSDPSGSLTKSVVEQNPITLIAENETANYVDYNFHGWRNNATNLIESTDLEYTINPEVHKSYTAIFKGYAKVNMLNTQDNGNSVGQNPTITWTDNPNQNVYYRVYRSPGLNGETWALASTVQKGVQTFNDGYHIITGSKEGDFCALRLEAVYSPDNTEVLADNVYFNTEEVAWKATAKNSKVQVITKYAIANYPNPFNPTTVINYQVPEAGHVTVKVYDIMGKEIATLVDGAKNKGSYNINFSMEQYHLSSGIYFCRMQAGKNITTTKMILSK